MNIKNIKSDLINSITNQLIEDVESGSFEPIEELLNLVIDDKNIKYFIGYLGNKETIDKYNKLLKEEYLIHKLFHDVDI